MPKHVKPPKGYTAVPRSKVGGYRKRSGKGWDYWYPPKGAAQSSTSSTQLALFADAKARLSELQQQLPFQDDDTQPWTSGEGKSQGEGMRILSLFSGIGGLDSGMESALPRAQIVGMVEQEPFAQDVLRRRFEGVPVHDDVVEVAKRAKELRPRPNVVTGGFPCQDLSGANQAACGLEGARSGLYREMLSIVEQVEPSWVVYENVPTLRSRGLEILLADHRELGYAVSWDGVPAQAVGAPHNRDRVFVIAHPPDTDFRFRAPDSDLSDHWRLSDVPKLSSNDPKARHPDAKKMLAAAGNAVVPQVAEHLGRLMRESKPGTRDLSDATPIATWSSEGWKDEGGELVTSWPRAGYMKGDTVYELPSAAPRRAQAQRHIEPGDVVWIRDPSPESMDYGADYETSLALDRISRGEVDKVDPVQLAELVEDNYVADGKLTFWGTSLLERSGGWSYRGEGGVNQAFAGKVRYIHSSDGPPYDDNVQVDIELPNGEIEPFPVEYLNAFPTPTKTDYKGGLGRQGVDVEAVPPQDPHRGRRKRGGQLRHWTTGAVNPEFAAYLMGLPEGWMGKSLSKAAKPPKGFTPIEGSKRGGYRKRAGGGGYVYWYPDGSGDKGSLSVTKKPEDIGAQDAMLAILDALLPPEKKPLLVRYKDLLAQEGESSTPDEPAEEGESSTPDEPAAEPATPEEPAAEPEAPVPEELAGLNAELSEQSERLDTERQRHEMEQQLQRSRVALEVLLELAPGISDTEAEKIRDAVRDRFGVEDEDQDRILDLVDVEKSLIKAQETYKVPESARNNAKKVLEWKRKHGSRVRGMTNVGWGRARQLASQTHVGIDTVRRMAAFNRHRKNAEIAPEHKSEPWRDAGYVAWLGWGGTTGVDWAREITGALSKSSAKTPAEPHERVKGSDRNRKGSAKDSKGKIEFSAATEKQIRGMLDKHNEKHPDHKVSMRTAKAVFRRGAGAFSVSHRPGMNRNQWALGRLRSFLERARGGKGHPQDDDLLDKAAWTLGDLVGELLYKARGTKYCRREPTGNPKRPWRYYYGAECGVAAARQYKAGDVLKLSRGKVEIEVVDEDGTVQLKVPEGQEELIKELYGRLPPRFSTLEWSELLTRQFGSAYTRSADRRARQAINAALRHVPESMLQGLSGTEAERLEQLKEQAPQVYRRLERAFRQAGMDVLTAKRVIQDTLAARGWRNDARAALIGNVLDPKKAWLATRYRRAIRYAENSRVEGEVTARQVQAAVDMLRPGGPIDNADKLQDAARSQILDLAAQLAEARSNPEAALDVLRAALASPAMTELMAVTRAAPEIATQPSLLSRGDEKLVLKVQDAQRQIQSLPDRRPTTRGGNTQVMVAGENGAPVALSGYYKLMEASEAIPSHLPGRSFAKHPDYPEGLQERAYHRDKAEQEKVRRNAKRMNPAFLVNTNPDALNGPPIMTEDNIVLGGNSRTMSMQSVYDENPGKAEELKNYLKEQAFQMGFQAEDVDALQNPILVRVVDTTGHDPNVLVRAMNESFIQAMDPRTMQVALGRRIDEQALSTLASTMQSDETLRQYLDTKRASGWMDELRRSGVIDDRNVSQYTMQSGKLNPDGKRLVERVLVGRMIDDPDLLSNSGDQIIRSVAGSVPYLMQAEESGEGYAVREEIQQALHAINRMNDQGFAPDPKAIKAGGKKADDAMQAARGQFMDLFEGDHPINSDPRAGAMFDLMVRYGKKPQKLSAVARRYAAAASRYAGGQGGLFGAPDPAQIFRESVTAEFDAEARAEREQREQAEREAAAAARQSLEGAGLFGKAHVRLAELRSRT